MELIDKLTILADAAKYDASCASSSAPQRNSLKGGIGSSEGMGICHAYTPDGRCVSLLKVLLTNFCIFDCLFCVNRNSSNVRRARFSIDELVTLFLGFYRRNYVEGLFLSSGIIRNVDYTMEQLVRVARSLREEHGFRGYIHLKAIPGADPALLAMAASLADRLSVNLELPTEAGLRDLAPEKCAPEIKQAMGRLRLGIEEAKAERKAPRFAPAGQSTQLVVGADASDDRAILRTSAGLYGNYALRRVYYSAFSPIPDSSRALPPQAPPLLREHRLYEADWLMRFYGFDVEEIVTGGDGMLALDMDPKLAWAFAHRGRFPVDVNTGSREELLRVPGLGVRSVKRILSARRHRRLRFEDLGRLRVSLAKVRSFVIAADGGGKGLDAEDLRSRLVPAPRQLGLFGGHA